MAPGTIGTVQSLTLRENQKLINTKKSPAIPLSVFTLVLILNAGCGKEEEAKPVTPPPGAAVGKMDSANKPGAPVAPKKAPAAATY